LVSNADNRSRHLNPFDFGLIVVVALTVFGFGLAKAGHAGVDKVIEGTPKVSIDVFITGLKTKDLELFKVGDRSSITIRNVPVDPPITVTKVQHWQKQISFPSPDGKKAVAFPDPANPIANDFLVTVTDQAEQTKDGYVIRGNKIKVGNQIDLEGFKYRVQGVVVDIRPGQ
jgi:hypothetical protein